MDRIREMARIKPVSLVGETTLTQAGAMVERASLVIGVDTGLSHMGIAFDRPTVTIFGSNIPYTKPPTDRAKVIVNWLECSPCRGNPTCNGAFTCTELISVEQVLETAREVLANHERRGGAPGDGTLRVLHLETGKHVYGGALQVLLLVEGLKRRGIENLLVVPEGSDIEAQARSRGLPVHPLPMAGEADLFFPPRFRRLIRSTAPDLVHLHSRRGADTLGGLGARWAGVPVVLTRRVDNPEPAWVLAAKYRLFDRVITISEAIRRVLMRQGVDPGRIRCVHSALDPSPFEGPCRRDAFLAGVRDGPRRTDRRDGRPVHPPKGP